MVAVPREKLPATSDSQAELGVRWTARRRVEAPVSRARSWMPGEPGPGDPG